MPDRVTTDAQAQGRPAELRSAIVVSGDAVLRSRAADTLRRDGIAVTATPRTAVGALEDVRRHRPDLVVLDLAMPAGGGAQVVCDLRPASPQTRILTLLAPHAEELAVLLLRLGADGCWAEGVVGLGGAATRVLDGETVLPDALSRQMVDELRGSRGDPEGTRPVKSVLTAREWEVLDLLCQGRSTEQITEQLTISVETARTHIKTMMARLGVHSRTEAVAMADADRVTLLRQQGRRRADHLGPH